MSSCVAALPKVVVLNDYGFAIWRHKYSKTTFVERHYDWLDRVIVIDELDGARQVVDDTQFSTFNFSDWIPVTVEEHKKIKQFDRDIYK